MPRRLHVFDMDGTLLNGAAALALSRHFDQLDVGLEIETRWQAGEITDTEFWTTLLRTCAHATESDIDAAFESADWLDGVADTFADIGRRGEAVIVISQSPSFFVDRLQGWGAHETYGSNVVIGHPVSADATLSPQAKVEITRDALERFSLSINDCVAYGDSSSDVDLFGWLSHTVAVNASATVRALARTDYQGNDLRHAYALGRTLLD